MYSIYKGITFSFVVASISAAKNSYLQPPAL